MRRSLIPLTVVAGLLVGAHAFADEAVVVVTDAPAADEGTSAFKREGALLDASPKTHRPMELSFWLGIPWSHFYYGCGYYGYSCGFPIGLGARFNIPVVANGFVPQINDSFDIEFGLDVDIYAGAAYPLGIRPLVEPRYTVYLLQNLAVYIKPVILGLTINPGYYYPVTFYYAASVGLVFDITKTITLRAEVGTGAIKGGIGIKF